jgi:hypothetical protein
VSRRLGTESDNAARPENSRGLDRMRFSILSNQVGGGGGGAVIAILECPFAAFVISLREGRCRAGKVPPAVTASTNAFV